MLVFLPVGLSLYLSLSLSRQVHIYEIILSAIEWLEWAVFLA